MRIAKAVWHKNDDAVSPVIGTILMVAITVVLAAVLWLMVSGMISTGNESKTTVNLASPQVQQVTRVTAGWDVTLNINKITPSDVKVTWTELKITIKSSSGSILQTQTVPIPDVIPPVVYPNVGTIGTYYVETTAGDTKMGAGDALKITGMTTAYEGARIELSKGGQLIGTSDLPTNFP